MKGALEAAAPAEQQVVAGESHSRTGHAALGAGGSWALAAAAPPAQQPWPSRGTAAYQACYCEENVYLLARGLLTHPRLGPGAELFAVFLSNHSKTVRCGAVRGGVAPSGAWYVRLPAAGPWCCPFVASACLQRVLHCTSTGHRLPVAVLPNHTAPAGATLAAASRALCRHTGGLGE